MIISTGRRNGKTKEMLKQAIKENELLGEALKNARQEIAKLKREKAELRSQAQTAEKRIWEQAKEDIAQGIKKHTKVIANMTLDTAKEVVNIYKDSEGKVDAEKVMKAMDRLKESEGKE